MLLNIKANRAARKWTLREQVRRVLWSCVHPVFRFSPRVLWGWRTWILRLFGASIGSGVHIYPSVLITLPWNLIIGKAASVGDRAILYNLGLICIGEGATISPGAHLCAGTHDFLHADLPLVKSPITIGKGAWICADAFVGPDVRVSGG